MFKVSLGHTSGVTVFIRVCKRNAAQMSLDIRVLTSLEITSSLTSIPSSSALEMLMNM